jgi:hypothetical protein
VVEVQPYPANDVLELDDGTLLPLVEDCVLDVDLDAGRIVVASGYAEHEEPAATRPARVPADLAIAFR